MITKIGIVAGEIWHYLEEHKEAKLSDLSEKLEKSRDAILMAVGWLSREGHVVLSGDESDYKISFRKKADAK
ncbi:winged helix-turn-helix domain-containing protein [Candidatus Omnitrophota bacterium]